MTREEGKEMMSHRENLSESIIAKNLLEDKTCNTCKFHQFGGVRYYCIIDEMCFPLPENKTCDIYQLE